MWQLTKNATWFTVPIIIRDKSWSTDDWLMADWNWLTQLSIKVKDRMPTKLQPTSTMLTLHQINT